MYDEMLFYDPCSGKLFSISCYLANFFDVHGDVPERFLKLMNENKIKTWLDDYLLSEGCIFIGHV